MNILYISALEGGKYTGPIYSVPNQIEAQSQKDQVYWVNLTWIDKNIIKQDVECNSVSCREFDLSRLPHPFDHPDLVVFEEFFKIENYFVFRIINKANIPFVIVPRGSMTYQYLGHKRLKKFVASVLFFNQFKSKAKAVQFLTEQEKKDSEKYYKGMFLLIPNGIHMPEQHTKNKYSNKIVGTFIGRYSIVQKGLDILLEAIYKQKEIIVKNNLIFEFYGPDERSGSYEDVNNIVEEYGLKDIVKVNGPVFDDEKRIVLEASDFFIHTSRFEGLPMAVLEALSYGVPCLVTEGSNVRREVEDYSAGWGCSTDVSGVENAIIQMIDSIGNLENYRLNAVSLAKKYSWNSIAIDTHAKYEDLIK